MSLLHIRFQFGLMMTSDYLIIDFNTDNSSLHLMGKIIGKTRTYLNTNLTAGLLYSEQA